MKKSALYMAAALALTGCATPTNIRVTRLGEEPAGVLQKQMYILPQTVLKVEIGISETVTLPGPYWEFAERYLGITEVIKKRSSHWQIQNVAISDHIEMDPLQSYCLNVIEGEFTPGLLEPYLERGLILDGAALVGNESTLTSAPAPEELQTAPYEDLGLYSNFEERTETMYKTLVTDTSYVRVPVQRTIVEQKSLSTKASEAADMILDLRLRRFDMLTGEYESFPQGEAMEAAIDKLDQLEDSYLSLFIGKATTRVSKRSWFIVPEPGPDPSRYRLGLFSGQLGLVPEELMEGDPLEVIISPTGKTREMEHHYSGGGGLDSLNTVLYRLPDVVDLKVVLGGRVLSEQRRSIFQSGTVVSSPLGL
jgi:hypothetical protein